MIGLIIPLLMIVGFPAHASDTEGLSEIRKAKESVQGKACASSASDRSNLSVKSSVFVVQSTVGTLEFGCECKDGAYDCHF